MNILVCPDKFKGSLTAKEVCVAVEQAIIKAMPWARVETMPLADGGEGTCALLTELHAGHSLEVQVHGPLFKPLSAKYGISKTGDSAFIEMAEASGLTLLTPEERNPLFTTTLGTGELIANALDRGVQRIILGLGGSATNDAGIGMASALGYDFYDASGELLKPIGKNLINIRSIRMERLHPRLKEITVTALCDVTNPLFGPDGAAYVYGPQKGASKSTIQILDLGLQNFRQVVHEQLQTRIDFPGAGAAGGLGAGAKAFLDARIERGVAFFVNNTNLAARVKEADLVITGEGKIDGQTFSGKVVSEVIRLAVEAKKTVYAICGICEIPDEEMSARGIHRVISLVDNDTSPESAVKHAHHILSTKVMETFKKHLTP